MRKPNARQVCEYIIFYSGICRWRASFTAKFIEEITHRTGNFKPFSVFVKMLSSAFEGDSGSVSLDILTSEDLEALRQSSGLGAGPRTNQTGPSSKRYLILTYQGEFDKVHYPMALGQCEIEDVGELKRTIVQLRDDLETSRRSNVDSNSVREWEQMLAGFKSEKEKLVRDLSDYSIENNRLKDLVDSLKGDNQALRLRVEFLESQAITRRGSAAHSFVTSPANSLRRGPSPSRNRPPGGSSPYGRRPPLPLLPPSSPIRRRGQAPPSLRSSPASSTRSERNILGSSPGRQMASSPQARRRPATAETPPSSSVPLSEVDARLQALQNFLRHQKKSSVH